MDFLGSGGIYTLLLIVVVIGALLILFAKNIE